MNHFNRDAEKALSAFDQTHVIKLNYSYELPFGPGKPFLTTGVLSKIVGGWRISGVHSYASGYPLSVFPGYGLPLNGGDNRITVLDYNGWRAPTRGDNFDPLVDLWWDPNAFRRDPVDTIDQLQGYKGGVLRAEFGNATVRNPNARGPWFLSENISVARTFGIKGRASSSGSRCSICSIARFGGRRIRRSPARTSARSRVSPTSRDRCSSDSDSSSDRRCGQVTAVRYLHVFGGDRGRGAARPRNTRCGLKET